MGGCCCLLLLLLFLLSLLLLLLGGLPGSCSERKKLTNGSAWEVLLLLEGVVAGPAACQAGARALLLLLLVPIAASCRPAQLSRICHTGFANGVYELGVWRVLCTAALDKAAGAASARATRCFRISHLAAAAHPRLVHPSIDIT